MAFNSWSWPYGCKYKRSRISTCIDHRKNASVDSASCCRLWILGRLASLLHNPGHHQCREHKKRWDYWAGRASYGNAGCWNRDRLRGLRRWVEEWRSCYILFSDSSLASREMGRMFLMSYHGRQYPSILEYTTLAWSKRHLSRTAEGSWSSKLCPWCRTSCNW